MRTKAHLGLLLLGALLVPATVCAHPRGSSADGAGYSVRVENEWGRELPTFYKGGQTYVLGGLGERYNLRVRNHTGTRVEAVITVDGRDVISGGVGDFRGERGYLVDAYGEVVIEGFRKTFDEVAAFRFSSPGNSYSSRMGTPENVGVIGVAMFPERPRQRPTPIARPKPAPQRYDYSYDERARRMSERSAGNLGTAQPSAASPAEGKASAESSIDASRSRGAGSRHYEYEAPSSYAPSPSTDNLGTEYGESVGSAAREVAFVRANATRPSAVLTVRYDDVEGLQARGIEVYPRRPIAQASPDPFPRNRFAAPPP
jgi:hypothetical protein